MHLFRSKFLDKAACYEQIRLINYGLQPLQVSLSFQFEADFADIFEVRGTKRAKKGYRLSDSLDGDAAILSYRGLDNVGRKTRIAFTPKPRVLTTRQARYEFTLEPKKEQSVFVTVSCERDSIAAPTAAYQRRFRYAASPLRATSACTSARFPPPTNG